MKKPRFFSLLLCFALAAWLFLPMAAAAEAPALTAPAALLVDVTYGEEVLYASNVHERMYPAGITCVMTGLLVLEAVERGELSLEQEITVTANAKQGLFWNLANADLTAGEVIPMDSLLRCALIAGASDACNALAEATAGSIDAFVARMNDRAAELGCEGTHFTSPHGLHNDDHYTTAWDLYLICRQAMEIKTFRETVSTTSATVPATNLHDKRPIYNTNALVSGWWYGSGYLYKYATGIRTGYTEEAGRCLAAAATNPKSDRTLICIVLGCERVPDSAKNEGYREFSEGKALLDWGFTSFSRRAMLSTTDLLGDVPVAHSKTEFVAAQPAHSVEATLPRDVPDSDFEYDIHWNAEQVDAPVKKGQVLGTVTVSYNGTDYGTVDLVAVADVERSGFLYILHRIGGFFSQTWVRVLLLTALILGVLALLWAVFIRRQSRRPRPKKSYGYQSRSRKRRHR